MHYINFEIVGQLNLMKKKISSKLLKVGDRFIINGNENLYFKTSHNTKDNQYLCCDEMGNLVWLDGDLKVERINGIAFELNHISKQFVVKCTSENN